MKVIKFPLKYNLGKINHIEHQDPCNIPMAHHDADVVHVYAHHQPDKDLPQVLVIHPTLNFTIQIPILSQVPVLESMGESPLPLDQSFNLVHAFHFNCQISH